MPSTAPSRSSSRARQRSSYISGFDYRVVVLSDCVASMYGDDLHVLGLQNIARCLGWVITNEQFYQKIRESAERRSEARC